MREAALADDVELAVVSYRPLQVRRAPPLEGGEVLARQVADEVGRREDGLAVDQLHRYQEPPRGLQPTAPAGQLVGRAGLRRRRMGRRRSAGTALMTSAQSQSEVTLTKTWPRMPRASNDRVEACRARRRRRRGPDRRYRLAGTPGQGHRERASNPLGIGATQRWHGLLADLDRSRTPRPRPARRRRMGQPWRTSPVEPRKASGS